MGRDGLSLLKTINLGVLLRKCNVCANLCNCSGYYVTSFTILGSIICI
jgi:hypothetical protein